MINRIIEEWMDAVEKREPDDCRLDNFFNKYFAAFGLSLLFICIALFIFAYK